jgi:hypothetical protein
VIFTTATVVLSTLIFIVFLLQILIVYILASGLSKNPISDAVETVKQAILPTRPKVKYDPVVNDEESLWRLEQERLAHGKIDR